MPQQGKGQEVMDDGQVDYMGAARWVSFQYRGEPEGGEARTMDDGSIWAYIAGLDPKGSEDQWIMVLDPNGNEADGVNGVQFSDVTMAVSHGDELPSSDEAKARFAKTDFILDMYESGAYDEAEAGERLFDHLFGKGRQSADSEG